MASSVIALPYAPESERAVLGAALIMAKHLDRVLDACSSEEFHVSLHRLLFNCIQEERNKEGGRGVEGTTIVVALAAKEGMDHNSAHDLVLECQQAAAGSVHLEEHLRILREHRILRGLIDILGEAEGLARTQADGADLLVEHVQGQLIDLSVGGRASNLHGVRDVLGRTYQQIVELSERKGQVANISTGLSYLDIMTGGFAPDQLIILAARPGKGKTAMALNIAAAAARKGHPVLFCTMEMSPESLMMRLLAAQGKILAQNLRLGKLDSVGFDQLTGTIQRIEDWPLFIDDTSALSLSKLRSLVRRLQATEGLDMVVIDYLQLMAAEKGNDGREQQVAALSRGLKQLARDTHIPILCLSQLNRSVEGRKDKRPMLSDLRESGAIEQDADLVCFIHREDSVEEVDGPLDAELILAKQRNGPVGPVHLRWLPSYLSFHERAREDEGF